MSIILTIHMLDQTSLALLTRTKLNEKQAKVYLALLQLGQASVSHVATEAELKRPITYIILEELVGLGYAQTVPGAKKTLTYAACDPNSMASELERTAQDFKEMLPYLRGMQRKAGKPYVTYYSGSQGSKRAFAQIRRPGEARYALSIQEALLFIPEEVARWKRAYLSGNARPGGRHLLADTEADRAYGTAISKAGQSVRYISQEQGLGIDLVLTDNMVFLATFDDIIHVTVIESEKLYHSLCVLYDLAWKQAAPVI